jgi:secreted Zn-dependent insulinase-like peptidase
MKTQNNKTTTKRVYSTPRVEQVKIDNEISLVMMSYPGDPASAPTQDPLMSIKAFKIFK